MKMYKYVEFICLIAHYSLKIRLIFNMLSHKKQMAFLCISEGSGLNDYLIKSVAYFMQNKKKDRR